MTFLEMKTDALDLLHELQNHSQYSETKLGNYLNRGSVEFVRKTECIEDTIDVTTVANQFEYTEADAAALQYLKLPYQVRYVLSSSEVGEPLTPFPGGYTNLPKTKSYSTPSHYWLRNIGGKTRGAIPSAYTGFRIGTWPICGTADKTIRIDGFMWPVKMTDDTHVPEYKDGWHEAPVFYAAYRLFMMFSHLRPAWHNKALEMKALFDELVITANQDLSKQDDAPFVPIDVQRQWAY